MLQIFEFTSSAAQPLRQIDAKGSFFRYESGSAGGADERVRVRADGNDLGTYYPGDAITIPIEATRWEVIPLTVGCSGSVRVGSGRVESARLLGTVSVVDGGKVRSLAGTAVLGSIQQTSGAATQPYVAAANQAGSGVNIAVKKVRVNSSLAGQITFGWHAEPFGTGAGAIFMKKKFSPQANAAKAEMRWKNFDAGAGDAVSFLGAIVCAANVDTLLEFEEPLVITPGYQLGLVGVLNSTLNVIWEATEDPV